MSLLSETTLWPFSAGQINVTTLLARPAILEYISQLLTFNMYLTCSTSTLVSGYTTFHACENCWHHHASQTLLAANASWRASYTLLPIISKVFEKLLFYQILLLLADFIYNEQFRFPLEHSTALQLDYVLTQLSGTQNMKQYMVVVLLYVSKPLTKSGTNAYYINWPNLHYFCP